MATSETIRKAADEMRHDSLRFADDRPIRPFLTAVAHWLSAVADELDRSARPDDRTDALAVARAYLGESSDA